MVVVGRFETETGSGFGFDSRRLRADIGGCDVRDKRAGEDDGAEVRQEGERVFVIVLGDDHGVHCGENGARNAAEDCDGVAVG